MECESVTILQHTIQWHLLCPHVLPPSSPEKPPRPMSCPPHFLLAPGNHSLSFFLWIYLSWIFRIHGIIYVTVRGSSDVVRESVLDLPFCFSVVPGWGCHSLQEHIPTRLPATPLPPQTLAGNKELLFFCHLLPPCWPSLLLAH